MLHRREIPNILNRAQLPEKILEEFYKAMDYGGINVPSDQLYWPNRLIESFLAALKARYVTDRSSLERLPPGLALAALFDLLVNALYAQYVTDKGWIYCLGPNGELNPSQYYPFVAACPRCTVHGRYISATAHKPQSAQIGDSSALALVLILRKVLSIMTDQYNLVATTATQADVDVFLYGPDLIVLGEIKASPLVSYPLEVKLDHPLTQEDLDTGEPVPLPNHEKDSPRVVSEAKTIYLYVPHRDLRIDLGPRNDSNWPFRKLVDWVSKPENAEDIVQAWKVLFDLYKKRDKQPSFYLTHGCGTVNRISISDSKNMPGLDRTDDIKKGTYQVLKYGAYYGTASQERVVKTALFGNVHPIVHFSDYLEKLEDVVWTKDQMLNEISETEVKARKLDIFNLFDGIICFTREGREQKNRVLARLFDWSKFAERLIIEGG